MPESTTMENNRALWRRTLIVVGAMVGGCAVVVGTLTLVATVIVDHAVGPTETSDAGGVGTQAPPNTLYPAGASGPTPGAGKTGLQRK